MRRLGFCIVVLFCLFSGVAVAGKPGDDGSIRKGLRWDKCSNGWIDTRGNRWVMVRLRDREHIVVSSELFQLSNRERNRFLSCVKIVGPDEMTVGNARLFLVKGLWSEYGPACKVTTFPVKNRGGLQIMLGQFGDRVGLYVRAVKPGNYTIVLDVNVPDMDMLVAHDLTVVKVKE